MRLHQSCVEIGTIALWLGHENIRTSGIYLHANLALKQRVLERTRSPDTNVRWYRAPDTLLAFLESLKLCRVTLPTKRLASCQYARQNLSGAPSKIALRNLRCNSPSEYRTPGSVSRHENAACFTRMKVPTPTPSKALGRAQCYLLHPGLDDLLSPSGVRTDHYRAAPHCSPRGHRMQVRPRR